jgi:hypothetical protein
MREYFVSYAHEKGFGNIEFSADTLTKENFKDWIMMVTKLIKERNDCKDIAILNIQEIK